MTQLRYYAPYDPREELAEVSQILPNLDMGKRPETYVGYDFVVSCEWHLAKKPMDNYEGLTLHVPMQDSDDFALSQWKINQAAIMVAEAVKADDRVLVHCSGGLNRSGVVVAKALHRLHPSMEMSEVIALIRKRRDEYALCNPWFERWLMGLGPTQEELKAAADG